MLQTLKIKKGHPFPALTVNRLDGGRAELRSILKPGRRTLINLWATWCGPCASEMPELDRLAPRLKANGVDLIGLSIDTDGLAEVRKFLDQRPVSCSIFNVLETDISRIFAGNEASVPISILLDQNGRVQMVISGWSKRTAREFESLTVTPRAAAEK